MANAWNERRTGNRKTNPTVRKSALKVRMGKKNTRDISYVVMKTIVPALVSTKELIVLHNVDGSQADLKESHAWSERHQ